MARFFFSLAAIAIGLVAPCLVRVMERSGWDT